MSSNSLVIRCKKHDTPPEINDEFEETKLSLYKQIELRKQQLEAIEREKLGQLLTHLKAIMIELLLRILEKQKNIISAASFEELDEIEQRIKQIETAKQFIDTLYEIIDKKKCHYCNIAVREKKVYEILINISVDEIIYICEEHGESISEKFVFDYILKESIGNQPLDLHSR